MEDTVEKAGRGVAWNAIVLAAGFFVLNLSSLKPNHSLGILLATAMVVCYAATFMLLPRLLRVVAPATAFLLLGGAVNPAHAAETSRCKGIKPDDAATELMRSLEALGRRDKRIVRMHVHTRYVASHVLHEYSSTHPIEKTLWGVFNGDPADTRVLYTFSGPGRLAGTSLLLQDFAEPATPDGMWLYLRSFDTFTKVAPRGQKVMVPGTGLTYEDARGFIATDKYTFSFTTQADVAPAANEALVLACPRDGAVRENLGYDSVVVLIDKDKPIVRRVEFSDLGGKPLKSYELVRDIQVGGTWQPGEVSTEHHGDGYTTRITYEHWLLEQPPNPALYEPDVSKEKFLPRLERVLTEAGLGQRIADEIKASQAQIRARDEQAENKTNPDAAGAK
jgi:hypothetical protein